ncbi:MAG: AAA family ATPase [Acidobacteriota bacterium]
MILLRSIVKKNSIKNTDRFPFNIPLVKTLKEIEFTRPVTFFVGENGSGKSTFLEAIAAGIGSVAVGGEDIQRDKTLKYANSLATQLKFVWNKKTSRGFFLRAEDFFNFAKRINRMKEELDEFASEFEENLTGYGLQRAKGTVAGQKAALIEQYGKDLDANSHGESFLKLFQARFVSGGLYLLDEPEAPLSPLRQLSLLSMLKDMIGQQAQFIIATHSPILMAFPDATIYSFDNYPVAEASYDELEHVCLTRAFLTNPESFLKNL